MSLPKPLGAHIRMADISENPYPIFAQLHAEEPVSWIEEIEMWFITRREDVQHVLADTQTFTVQHEGSVLNDVLGTNMLTTDGTEQYHLRKPFMSMFTPQYNRSTMTGYITTDVHQLLDGFFDKGQAEFKQNFADALALRMVTTSLGLPIEDFEMFRGWYSDFANGLSDYHGDPAIRVRALQSKQEFADYVLRYVRGETALMPHAPLKHIAESSQLTDDQIVDAVRVIIFGGLETTAALLANALWALLTHPDQCHAIQEDTTRLTNAIEEVLRWESPVQTATRYITQDVQIAGVQLRQGQMLQCMLGAANRDATYFNEPDRFDINRPNARNHLSFGYGKHFCIGASLARLEAQIALPIILERLSNLQLIDPQTSKPVGHEFRAPHQLELTWDTSENV